MENDSSYGSRLADSYSEAASSLRSSGFTNLSGSETFSTSTGMSTGKSSHVAGSTGISDATSGFGGGLSGLGGRDASGALGGGGLGGELLDPTLMAENGSLLQSFDPVTAAGSGMGTVAQPISAQTNMIGAGGVNPGAGGSYVNTTDAYASPAGIGGAATKRASTFDTSSFTIGEPRVVKVVSAGKGWTKVQLADGSVELRNGDRASRNFNPGNIEYNEFSKSGGPGFAPRNGAVGTDGRFAVFPDQKTGLAAQQKLLFSDQKYKDLTIAAAINEYAPPKENDTGAYIRSIADAAGVPTDTVLSDMTPTQQKALIAGMHKVEGNTGYKTTKIKESDYTPTDRFSTAGDQEIAMFELGAVIDDIDRPGSAYLNVPETEAPIPTASVDNERSSGEQQQPAAAVDIPNSAGMSDERIDAELAALNGTEIPRVAPDAAPVRSMSINPEGEVKRPSDPVERLESIYLAPHSTPSELAAQSSQETIRSAINLNGSTGLAGVAEQKAPEAAPQAPTTRVANAFEDVERSLDPTDPAQMSPATRIANAFEDVERTGPLAASHFASLTTGGRPVKTTSIPSEPGEEVTLSKDGTSLTPAAPGNPTDSVARKVAITSEPGAPASTATINPVERQGEIVPASETTPVDDSGGITINPRVGKVLETGIDVAAGGINPILGTVNLLSGLAGGPTVGKLATKGIQWALNNPGEKELLERSARVDGTVNGWGDDPRISGLAQAEDPPDETEEERLDTRYLNPVDEIWRPKPHERWGPDSRRYR